MKIELSKLSQNETKNLAKSSVLVTFATSAKKGKEEITKLTDNELSKRLTLDISEKLVSAKIQDVTTYRSFDFKGFHHVAVVGLGGGKLSHENIRQVAASILSAVKALSATRAVIQFDEISGDKRNAAPFIQSLAEGLLLSDYNFDELKSKKKEEKKELSIVIQTKWATDATCKRAFNEGTILAECVNFSRRLGDMPGNFMTPTILADEAVAAAKGTGIKATVWDKARIKKEKMGGLLGVSNGSAQEPRFIILEYRGAAASKKPIVFVGKGLTFDCGGISIKPSAGMEEMKYDMCGGAAMIGTLLAIAKLKLKINAVALIPATENLAGPAATKPGDIHTARNGKTFEVNNTDAEGRLILADALCYASEMEPSVIIDAATLTGAMVVALGNTHTGYFTRNENLKKKIESAADRSGEWVWNMPLTDHHVKDMKGTFADLSNISSSKGAGSATAAAFLEQFVGEGIPWAHFDIAGTAWSVGNRLPYCSKKGASGVMIRTFVELARGH